MVKLLNSRYSNSFGAEHEASDKVKTIRLLYSNRVKSFITGKIEISRKVSNETGLPGPQILNETKNVCNRAKDKAQFSYSSGVFKVALATLISFPTTASTYSS